MSAQPQNPPVAASVIILTFNEARTIAACLSFLDGFDDVILVDSGSTDETVSVARSARPDVRVYENSFEDFGQQRNWAIDNTSPRHDWVLFLDADEHCNDACRSAIANAISVPGENVGYYLTCRNYFLDKWIKRCTLYPSWQLRLFRRGEVRYRKEGHGQREVTEGQLGYLDAPYDHYGFSNGIAHWISRHNRYSSHEVELIERLRREPLQVGDLFQSDPIVRRRCLKRLAAHAPFRPAARFFYLYILRMGFLDGRAGLIFCLLRVSHEIHIVAKLAEAEFHHKQAIAAHSSPDPSASSDVAAQQPAPSSHQRSQTTPEEAGA